MKKIQLVEKEKNNIGLSFEFKERWLDYTFNDEEVCNELIKFKGGELFYNFFLIVKYCYDDMDLSENNAIEEKIYLSLGVDREWYIIKMFQLMVENIVNEMIKKDIDVCATETPWVSIGLDSFYYINIWPHHLSESLVRKILPRTKNLELARKIINYNLVVSTITRHKNIFLFYKLKKNDYPKQLTESIFFTKGYLICLEPKLVDILKMLIYRRKLPLKEALTLKPLKKMTFRESLLNESYNEPIWMKENNTYNLVNLNEKNIFNYELLDKSYDVSKALNVLNYLNSCQLTFNFTIFHKIYATIENTPLNNFLISKNTLQKFVYNINSPSSGFEFDPTLDFNLQKFVNSTAVLELIKAQIKRYPFFYLNYRFDLRMRIYCYNWPINYQLNHIIRNILKFSSKVDITFFYTKFFNHPFIKKYMIESRVFLYQHTNILDQIIQFSNKTFGWDLTSHNLGDISKKMKLEVLIIYLVKLAPRSVISLDDKIKFSMEIFDDFVETNLTETWKEYCLKLQISEKKIPYIINYQQIFINMKLDIYEDIFWGDASSNAIQLITLRLNKPNNELLMLTNIIENTTPYHNIYAYITQKIKETNHDDFLKTIDNLITAEELNSLQTDESNKYTVMPAVYGMGKYSARHNLEKYIIDNNKTIIWDKLDKKKQNKVSDYFWSLTFFFLKKLGFDITEYKNICATFNQKMNTKYYGYIWPNDYGLLVFPIKIRTTQRQKYINKINLYKVKLKETLDEKKKKF